MKYIGQHIFDYVASFRQNVGMGTDTPNAALHVYKTTGIISESPGNATITIRRNDNVQYGALLKYHSGNTEKWVAGLSDAGDFTDSTGNEYFIGTAKTSPKFLINSSGDVTIPGNLTVSGTTTTINTANLNVEDKNITINYSTGDSSSTADGAGITIQDAVDSSTDATILWDATTDRFDFSNDIQLPDNKILNLGSGSADLQLLHDGNNSHVVNYTGDLKFTNNANDKDVIFNCDDGSGGNTEYFRLDGGTETNIFTRPSTFNNTVVMGSQQLKFADNGQIRLGDSNDLNIYHDSADSQIINSTGNLIIRNNADDGDIRFRSDDGTGSITTYITLDGGNTRTLFSQEARFSDNVNLKVGDGGDTMIYHDGSDSYIDHTGTGNLYVRQGTDDADIVFQCDDGTGGLTEYFRLDGSFGGGDGTGTRFTIFPDKSRIGLGNNADLRMNHDGTDSHIINLAGHLTLDQRANDKDIVFKSDDGSGGVTEYFRVDGGSETIVISKPLNLNAELNLGAISTTGSGTVVKGGFLNPATEAQAVHQPQIVNDLAGFFKWGTIVTSGLFNTRSGSSGSFSYSNEWQASNTAWNRAFDSTSSHPGSFFSNNGVDGNSVTPGVIELQWPTEITYSLNVGIVFGSGSFTPTNVKIEAYKGDGAGGFAWQTLCDLTGNTETVILRKVDGNSGIGSATKRLKFTLGGSNTSIGYFRIHTIYMANYQAGNNNISNLGLDFTKGVHSLQKYDLNYVWGSFHPAQNNTYDLGTSSYKWKDSYFDGTVTLDGLTLDGNTITGIDDSGEFTDDDAHIMTSAGIRDKFGFAYFQVVSSSDDYDNHFIRGGYRFQGASNGPSTNHTTGFTIIEDSGNYGWQMVSFGSADNTESLFFRYKGTSAQNWQTIVTKTLADNRYLQLSGGTLTGDLAIGPKNNATVQVSESGGSTVKMLAGSVGRVGTYSNHNFIITQNSGDAITIDNSRNATFAGTITSSNLATKNVVLVHGAGGVVGNSGSNSSDSHTWTITHGMGSSRNYKVEVMLNSGNYDTVYPDITRPSDTTIVITFGAAVANSAYKALILKCE